MMKTNILVVDDRPEGILAVQAVLDNQEYNLITASSGGEALKCLLKDDFAVILLDVQMPIMNGFETAAVIKTRERSRDIPIVFMSAINQDELYVYQGYRAGAVDYLLKPFDPYILRSKVAIFVEMYKKNQLIKDQARRLHDAEIKSYALAMDKMEIDSLRRYQYLADAIPQIVFRVSPEGIFEYFNKTWFEYTGYRIQSMQGHGWKEAIHPEDRPELDSALLSHSVNLSEFECRILNRKGQYRWHLFRIQPEIQPEQPKLKNWLGTATDIEDRKQSEETQAFLARAGELLVSSLNYEETLNSVAQLVVPQLADWCAIDILDEQDQLKSIVAIHRDETKTAIVKDLHEHHLYSGKALIGPGNVIKTGKSEMYQEIDDAFLEKYALDANFLKITRDLNDKSAIIVPLHTKGKIFGTMMFVFSTSGRRYNTSLLHMAEDFGKRVALAYENAKLYQLAQDSVQLRNDFLSIAAHELNTPITSLKLQLQMSRKALLNQGESPENDKFKKSIDASVKQVDRLINLIQVLLDVSRIQSGKFTFAFSEMDLCEVIQEVADRNKELILSSKCQLSIECDKDLIVVWDKTRIEQVILNLLMNAMKYAPGKIEIKVFNREDDVTLEFKDYGNGISSDKIKSIFDRFERANSSDSVGGLGLGLYIVKQIIEGHQGHVNVGSEIGHGTLFTIVLPKNSAIKLPSTVDAAANRLDH